MAAGTATRRASVEVLTDSRGTVRIIEDGQVRKLRAGSRRDPGLWDADVEFVLNQAESVLGLRGATGAVISMIEHGGARGEHQHDEVMLRRVGCIEGSKVPVRRAKELIARWRVVPRQHQAVLLVHYQARDSRTKAAQYVGFCSGVALLLAPAPGALLAALDKPTDTQHARTIGEARERAEAAVRAAHEAWQTTGRPYREPTKLEQRRERVDAFLEEAGL